MKESSVTREIIKIILWMFCGWILWLLVFAIFTPDEEEISDLCTQISFVLGIITGMIITIVLKYNSINKLYQDIKESKSNIDIIRKKNEKLLKKANDLTDKYMKYEKEIHTTISKNRTVKTSSQLQLLIENYPELKANENILELIKEIKETEDNIADSKITYNSNVSKYNTLINSFPASIMKKIFKCKEADYYIEEC